MSNMKKNFRIAIEEKDEVTIMNILANGVDPNANIPGEKFAPIHYSAGLHESITRLLLDHGADPNIKTIDGLTPLHIAASWGQLDIVKLLLEKGANVANRDDDGNTPMDLAKDYKHSDCMKILRRCLSKAEHHLSSKGNYTPRNKPTYMNKARSTKAFNLSRPKMSNMYNLKTTFLMTPENISSRIKITLKNRDFEKSYDVNLVPRDSQNYSAFDKDFNSRKNKNRNTRTEYSGLKRTSHHRTSQGISSFMNNNSNDKHVEAVNNAENYYSCDEYSETQTCETLTQMGNFGENGELRKKTQFRDDISDVSAEKSTSSDSSHSVLEIDPDYADHVSEKQSNCSCERSNTSDDDEISCDEGTVDNSETSTQDATQDATARDLSSYTRKKWLKRAQKYVQVKVMSCIRQNKYTP
ncbi:ankyrin repeat, SAM and basic leucine zipper domain-containing protein 1 [Octopus bimaculoides]|uniref:Uncharacterized protein n=1 Tax=Octopus bimaculoides TaxID=37653 RepID=A0A0L8HGL7_OCTBM|nr:ankyrin repeat, SAM and basic leucine zipper domain-containing protein 1 [Octopus bimaculoides]|eukprot:XP_014772755.1 PREDICTED: ankyrin repeat, SAM and basic leucine zipper domain-containing protein 1-like [Octopus bimaculoides]